MEHAPAARQAESDPRGPNRRTGWNGLNQVMAGGLPLDIVGEGKQQFVDRPGFDPRPEAGPTP